MIKLEDYRKIVGDDVMATIKEKAQAVKDKRLVHISSTSHGGGVAEMLATLVPLMNKAGVETGWRILRGNPDFFTITKKFHNALQGEKINFSEIKKQLYVVANQDFSVYTHISHDCVVIHDPQPLPLIEYYDKRQPWMWRCHVDLTSPNKEVWEYLKLFIKRFDLMVVSNKDYFRVDMPIDQKIMYPAIDPLAAKNCYLSSADVAKYLKKFDIPIDKPLITQISRFDKWKDPHGVIEAFKTVREKIDCRLVLCGSIAADDPGGLHIRKTVLRKEKRLIEDGDLVIITSENNILVNALQRMSAVIIQKSIREGFGLTVAEALWKEKPVIASDVGGIPLQIEDGKSGFLVEPHDINGTAQKTIEILENPDMAAEMGRKGKETIRERFLITRLLIDYLDILRDLTN